jgi:hypothetical protein
MRGKEDSLALMLVADLPDRIWLFFMTSRKLFLLICIHALAESRT